MRVTKRQSQKTDDKDRKVVAVDQWVCGQSVSVKPLSGWAASKTNSPL